MTGSSFSGSSKVGDRALGWWKWYCAPGAGDPETRARLSRCRSAQQAITIPGAIALVRQLTPDADAADERVERALNLARVLAHVRTHVPVRAMRALGWQSFPGNKRDSEAAAGRPRLSEARFRRLMLAEGGEELVTAFVRLLALSAGETNVSNLAEDFWFWGEKVRRRWAFDYYAASVAAPASTGASAVPEEVDS